MTVDISCVLTLHGEGIKAHPTFCSLDRARRFARQRGVTVELVVVKDKIKPHTERYLAFHGPSAWDKTITTDFGDPGLARNVGVEVSLGRSIFIMDGDDLISENWFYEAHYMGLSDSSAILHPEVNISFGERVFINYSADQTLESFDPSNIMFENYWTALLIARREVFQENPYKQTSPLGGFGFEDWHWNCEVMSKGYVHRSVPKTAHFIRIKPDGRNFENNKNNTIIRYPTLFDRPDLLYVRPSGSVI